MQKIINNPSDVVDDYLSGLAAAHCNVVHHDNQNRIIVRAVPGAPAKVGLVAGGGSGCEPTHTGFVGPGMLDAAAPGEIFTSPVPNQIIAAIRAADHGSGVVCIVKNFTGEVMNFGIAAEILEFEGITFETVLVNDDASVPEAEGTAGRRGLGATLLAEKIAGAAAERGDELDAVVAVARRVVSRARTFAIGLSSCTPPSRGKPIFDMPCDCMELGIGISGEPGRERVALRSARDMAEIMIGKILADLGESSDARTLCLVNGMGSTPLQELYILNGEAIRNLNERGFIVTRNIVGNFVTALDQRGAAITLLKVDDDMLELWDAPVNTPALRW